MNNGIKLRLIALGLAVGLMGTLIVLVTLALQNQAGVTRARLAQMDSESFRVEDHFRDKLRYANDKMRRYAVSEDAATWEEFLTASQELKGWIEEQQSRLTTKREQELVNQMNSANARYMQRARDLRVLMVSDSKTGASVAEYNSFFEQSRSFMDLGRELAKAHYDSRNEVLNRVNRTLTQLRLSVLGLVGLLFLFGLALALGVYRHLIAPLRVQLVESQALAERHEKLASLGLLAAGVAHEIRNPLTAVKAALFTQQKNLAPASQARKDGEVIEREISRLERIVTGFLQFARPAEPAFATVPADLPLRQVEALLSPQLASAGIELVREESPPARIKADPAQIQQALINLVQNAAESIGRSGKIILRARPARKRLANGETDVVVLEVADNGKGMPPEVEKKLFDPFFTTKETGTGLGLSIAARIVERNGGALQYQTQLNRGSTFSIVLPGVLD